MFQKIIDLNQCPSGSVLRMPCGEKMVAVFHLTNPDRFVVSDYQCPHAGADLTGGQLRRHYIICPQHQWKFDLITGHCVSDDQAILRRYECQVIGNELHADLDQPLPISPPAHYNF